MMPYYINFALLVGIRVPLSCLVTLLKIKTSDLLLYVQSQGSIIDLGVPFQMNDLSPYCIITHSLWSC